MPLGLERGVQQRKKAPGRAHNHHTPRTFANAVCGSALLPGPSPSKDALLSFEDFTNAEPMSL
jgi:hypothetical protein